MGRSGRCNSECGIKRSSGGLGEEVTGRGETGRWEKTEIKLIYIPFVSQVNNKDIGIDQHVFLPTPTFDGQK